MNNDVKVKKPNFWIRGKLENKKFYEIKLTWKTNVLTFVLGLVLAVIVVLPLVFMIYQYLFIFGYNLKIFFLYLTIIWIVLMIFNGLSNYFTVKFAQSANKDIVNLQAIKAGEIFFYQIFNFGFGVISLLLILFFGFNILGAIK